MKSRSKLLGLMLLGSLAGGTGVTGAMAQDASSSASPSTTPPAGEKIWGCIQGFADLLPGEYYACRAKYDFQRKHYGMAVERLRDAAHWANKDAQYTLGVIYFNGQPPDVPANRPLALAWLALAAERKSNDAYVQTYAAVRQQSSPQDIQAAGALWGKMKLEYGDKVAGLRAMRQFNRGIRALDEAANYGGPVWLNGFSPYPEQAFVVVNHLHAVADHAFDGLQGTVTVGDLVLENRLRPLPAQQHQ